MFTYIHEKQRWRVIHFLHLTPGLSVVYWVEKEKDEMTSSYIITDTSEKAPQNASIFRISIVVDISLDQTLWNGSLSLGSHLWHSYAADLVESCKVYGQLFLEFWNWLTTKQLLLLNAVSVWDLKIPSSVFLFWSLEEKKKSDAKIISLLVCNQV